ncbi:MAG: hypothetical protein WDW36_000549 [Sanguina aurantia]
MGRPSSQSFIAASSSRTLSVTAPAAQSSLKPQRLFGHTELPQPPDRVGDGAEPRIADRTSAGKYEFAVRSSRIPQRPQTRPTAHASPPDSTATTGTPSLLLPLSKPADSSTSSSTPNPASASTCALPPIDPADRNPPPQPRRDDTSKLADDSAWPAGATPDRQPHGRHARTAGSVSGASAAFHTGARAKSVAAVSEAAVLRPAQEAAAANTRRWYTLLQAMREQGSSAAQFVYLHHADPATAMVDPYNLVVASHSVIKGMSSYYTLSGAGVTHFRDGGAEFATLAQFEREFFLHTELLRMRTFSQFRVWKAWRVWRRDVARGKRGSARESLGRQLFLLDPVFRVATLRVRQHCLALTQLRMHALQTGQLLSLNLLTRGTAAQLLVIQAALGEFANSTLALMQAACVDSLQAVEDAVVGVARREGAAASHASRQGTAQSSRPLAATVSSATAFLANTLPPRDPSASSASHHALHAARRSHRRRLHHFVRLLEYVAVAALAALLGGSTQDLLAALTPSKPDPFAPHPARAAPSPDLPPLLGRPTPVQPLPAQPSFAFMPGLAVAAAAGEVAADRSSTPQPGTRDGGGTPRSGTTDGSGTPQSVRTDGSGTAATASCAELTATLPPIDSGGLDSARGGTTTGRSGGTTNSSTAGAAPASTTPGVLATGGKASVSGCEQPPSHQLGTPRAAGPATAAAAAAGDLAAGTAATPLPPENETLPSPFRADSTDPRDLLGVAGFIAGLARAAGATRAQRQQESEQRRAHHARLQLMQAGDPALVGPHAPKAVAAPVATAGVAGGGGDPGLEAAQVPQWGGPFLSMEIVLDGSDVLVLVPSPAEVVAHVTAILDHFVALTMTVPRFITSPRLQGFMEAPVDGGGVSVGGCAATLAGQHDHSSMAAQILAKVGEAMTRAGRFMETLQGFRAMLLAQRSTSWDTLHADVQGGTCGLGVLEEGLVRFQRQLEAVQALPLTLPIGVVQVHLGALVATLQPSAERCLALVRRVLPALAARAQEALSERVGPGWPAPWLSPWGRLSVRGAGLGARSGFRCEGRVSVRGAGVGARGGSRCEGRVLVRGAGVGARGGCRCEGRVSVHDATARLTRLPTRVHEIPAFLDLLAAVEAGREALDAEHRMVISQHTLMARFDIETSDVQTIAVAGLEEARSALGDALWAAGNQRERLADAFHGSGCDL